jgi:hypothetical protein
VLRRVYHVAVALASICTVAPPDPTLDMLVLAIVCSPEASELTPASDCSLRAVV